MKFILIILFTIFTLFCFSQANKNITPIIDTTNSRNALPSTMEVSNTAEAPEQIISLEDQGFVEQQVNGVEVYTRKRTYNSKKIEVYEIFIPNN